MVPVQDHGHSLVLCTAGGLTAVGVLPPFHSTRPPQATLCGPGTATPSAGGHARSWTRSACRQVAGGRGEVAAPELMRAQQMWSGRGGWPVDLAQLGGGGVWLQPWRNWQARLAGPPALPCTCSSPHPASDLAPGEAKSRGLSLPAQCAPAARCRAGPATWRGEGTVI